jgi:hypothetical protein
MSEWKTLFIIVFPFSFVDKGRRTIILFLDLQHLERAIEPHFTDRTIQTLGVGLPIAEFTLLP